MGRLKISDWPVLLITLQSSFTSTNGVDQFVMAALGDRNVCPLPQTIALEFLCDSNNAFACLSALTMASEEHPACKKLE